MKMPWTNRKGPARLLAICATLLLVAGGLCGLQSALFGDGSASILTQMFIITGVVELAAMLLSVLGLVAGAVWLIAKAIRNRNSARSPNEDQND